MNTNPGDRPLSLAGQMNHLAGLLENKQIQYNWNKPTTCNCGLLARSSLGLSRDELSKLLTPVIVRDEDGSACWKAMASCGCSITGEPIAAIFKKLAKAGLLFSDFADLEYLQNPVVLKRVRGRIGWRRFFLSHKSESSLAQYLRAWASLIEEHHAARSASPTEAQLEAVETRPLVASK